MKINAFLAALCAALFLNMAVSHSAFADQNTLSLPTEKSLKADLAAALADGEGDGAAVRCFADGVVEQVGQRLLQPERVGAELDGGAVVRRVAVMDEAQGEIFLCEARLLFALLFTPQGGEVKRLFVHGFFFDARQLQQALHEAVQPRALLGDVGGEAGAVGGGQVVLQQFGAGADGGERAFQFVGEGFDVAGDVGAVFEFAPHVADGSGEAVQFGGEVEARRGRDGRVRGGVTADAVDAAPYPQGEQGDEGEGCAEVKQAALAQVVFGALLVGDEVGARFAEADDAKQAAVGGVDGGSDVHGVLGAARAVFAAQGAQDVVPAAVVFAGLRRFAVKEDDARAIGDDELLAVRGFVVLVDVAALATREREKPDAVLPLPGVLVPGTIRWDIQVLPLLIGRVQVLARHDSMAQPVEISGTFARPRFSAGSIRLPNVSLSRLGSPWSTVQPTASLALSWEPFEIVNGKANGVAAIELRDVASALTPVRPLGAYRLDIDGRQADTMLNMSSIEGPLRLSGEGVFNPSHGLRFTAWAEVDESERLKLAPLVRLLGRQEGTRTMIKIGA